MIRERGEPAIADTSKPIIEPPVFPDYPENTQTTRPVAEDPDLVGGDDDEDADVEDDEDLDDDIDEEVSDEADEDFTEVKEPAVFKDEEFLEEEDEDDEF